MFSKKERLLKITDMLEKSGSVSCNALSQALQVSNVTIRKDLDELAGRGLVERTFGGAILKSDDKDTQPSPNAADALTAFHYIPTDRLEKYQQLAKKALEYVEPGDTLFLGSGITCCVFAEMLPENQQISVVTNNLSALSSLISKKINVFLIGGEVATLTGDSYFSSIAEPGDYMDSICVNKAFTSCYGIDSSAGITVESIISSYVFKALPNMQDSWYIMVSPEKFGRVGMYKICSVENVEKIIFTSMPENFRDYCLKNHISMAQADDPSTP